MDFREEYKKSAEIMTPSAEAMERMKKNILAQTVNAPAKKAIPFKKISMIGGAVAACAVISVSAVTLLPMIKTPDSMVANGTGSLSMAAENVNSIADRDIDIEAGKEEVRLDSNTSPSDEDGISGGMDNAADDINTVIPDETCDYAETGAAGESGEAPTYPSVSPDDVTGESANGTGAAGDDTGEAPTDPPEVNTGDAGEAPADLPEVSTGDTGEAMDETGAAEDETGNAEETEAPDITIELNYDLSVAVLDGVKYILTDDGTSPPQGVDMEFSDRFDGTTEYWVDLYGEDYFVLSTMDGRIIGGYTKVKTVSDPDIFDSLIFSDGINIVRYQGEEYEISDEAYYTCRPEELTAYNYMTARTNVSDQEYIVESAEDTAQTLLSPSGEFIRKLYISTADREFIGVYINNGKY